MKTSPLSIFINFLSLLPGTLLTILTIAVAFLRFYDEQDFTILGQITEPRLWSNRLTVAALVVAVVNFGVVERSSCEAWNRRNRETNRLAEEERRRSEEATRADQERVERRYREIQRDAYGSVFRPTRNKSRKKPSRSGKRTIGWPS